MKHVVDFMQYIQSEQFSIDYLFDKLLFINKVEIGLAQSENGQVNTKEQAKQKLSKWLK